MPISDEDKTYLILKYSLEIIEFPEADYKVLGDYHTIPYEFFSRYLYTANRTWIPRLFFYQRCGIDQLEEFYDNLLRFDSQLDL